MRHMRLADEKAEPERIPVREMDRILAEAAVMSKWS